MCRVLFSAPFQCLWPITVCHVSDPEYAFRFGGGCSMHELSHSIYTKARAHHGFFPAIV